MKQIEGRMCAARGISTFSSNCGVFGVERLSMID